jgi:hypothetical protein
LGLRLSERLAADERARFFVERLAAFFAELLVEVFAELFTPPRDVFFFVAMLRARRKNDSTVTLYSSPCR